MKIIHIADVHWRGLSRHDEYTESFEDFFKKCRELEPDLIYIGGDIVHSKTQGISPEIIDRLSWWFSEMSKIAPTHVILGNHDGLILNKHRQDAISPIVSALDNPNIYLYKKSGTYPTGIPGVNWCVFSCFDEAGWANVRPVEGDINIALFHGAVWGSKTDVDWEIEGDVTVDLFENFDFSFLGDIHKRQFLNEKKSIAYCGSTIQQNYGEISEKGFLFWDIKNKDDFTCKFYDVKNPAPFITVDWMGSVSETIIVAQNYPKGSRFRIRSKMLITQADSQEISSRLRSDMHAKEVVFKNENQFDVSLYHNQTGSSSAADNLRDISSHQKLFRDFFKNHEISDEEKDDVIELIEKYFSVATEGEEVLRNTRWEIENIEFDNLFSYGKNNEIDFVKNPGITGIFGKNTKGKSSIIGALMYCLFNTTDRGPVKNIDIVNSRKNFGRAKVDILLNGEIFRITRGTVKHTTRKGETYASTSLDLKKISSSGEVIENLTEEQRRETEKVLRKLIGTSDDFLMTSLASQGGMNNFLSEGATSRKKILTKFLDLEIFEKMYDLCKQDSATIRSIARSIQQEDWDTRIEEIKKKIDKKEGDLLDVSKSIESLRSVFNSLRDKKIKTFGDSSDYYTQAQIDLKIDEIDNINIKIDKLKVSIDVMENKRLKKIDKLKKINDVCDSISIDELKLRRSAKINLEKSIIELKNHKEIAAAELDRLNLSASKLNLVPCGDKFPTCMFIKGSHQDKGEILNQAKAVDKSILVLEEARESLKILKQFDPEDKIRKYDALILKTKDVENEILVVNSKHRTLTANKEKLDKDLYECNDILRKMRLMVVEDEDDPAIQIQKKIDKTNIEINLLEAKRIKLIEQVAEKKVTFKRLILDKENYDQIKKQMRVYDLFLSAVSKKGIPTRIMMSRLPVINSEISNILQGVVEFTVSLEVDQDTNSMDVYIDYGDSKRVIELASGMEKMISSLAIRVGLINTSSLTKTNMIIIDEGFGSLDANNLESCTRLLESLNKWFRNILIISHVDAIKDCVDNSIEITKKGKDSNVIFS